MRAFLAALVTAGPLIVPLPPELGTTLVTSKGFQSAYVVRDDAGYDRVYLPGPVTPFTSPCP